MEITNSKKLADKFEKFIQNYVIGREESQESYLESKIGLERFRIEHDDEWRSHCVRNFKPKVTITETLPYQVEKISAELLLEISTAKKTPNNGWNSKTGYTTVTNKNFEFTVEANINPENGEFENFKIFEPSLRYIKY